MKKLFQLVGALCLAISLLGGCQLLNLDRQATVQGRLPLRPAAASPDSVAMEIVWARVAAGDRQLNETIWRDIDEAPIEPAAAHELARNGFRAGIISGALPEALARALNQDEEPPTESAATNGKSLTDLMFDAKIRRRMIQVRRGRRVEIQASEVYPTLPLLMNNGQELGGGTYRDAQAVYSLEVDPQPDRMALVQLTPELHHGSQRVRWTQGDEGILRQAPLKDHKVFDRLRLKVKLSPGEILVLMNLPDSGSRLGQYFHTVDGADGRQQKLILIRLAEVPQSDTFASVDIR